MGRNFGRAGGKEIKQVEGAIEKKNERTRGRRNAKKVSSVERLREDFEILKIGFDMPVYDDTEWKNTDKQTKKIV